MNTVMALWCKYVMADNEQGGFTTITVGFEWFKVASNKAGSPP